MLCCVETQLYRIFRTLAAFRVLDLTEALSHRDDLCANRRRCLTSSLSFTLNSWLAFVLIWPRLCVWHVPCVYGRVSWLRWTVASGGDTRWSQLRRRAGARRAGVQSAASRRPGRTGSSAGQWPVPIGRSCVLCVVFISAQWDRCKSFDRLLVLNKVSNSTEEFVWMLWYSSEFDVRIKCCPNVLDVVTVLKIELVWAPGTFGLHGSCYGCSGGTCVRLPQSPPLTHA